MRASGLYGIVMGTMLAGCATVPPAPVGFTYGEAARSDAESLRMTVAAMAGAWENLNRCHAAKERIAELGLTPKMHAQWIDWFTPQRNIILELPGATSETVYVIAHYDKAEMTPVAVASILLNGLLDEMATVASFSRGAKDNGSGVAVALQLATWLAARTNHYTYRILLSGAEEAGLRGARAHVASLDADARGQVVLAMNIDTVGIAGASNCVIELEGDRQKELVDAVCNAAEDMAMPLDRRAMDLGMASDYVPFERNSWWRDVLRSIGYNLPGGFLPQRSWFTGYLSVPVISFSAIDAVGFTDELAGTVFLPIGALHGPRDNANGVDVTRLYEQYAIAKEVLRRVDAGLVALPR